MFMANQKYYLETGFLILVKRVKCLYVFHIYVPAQSQNWTPSWSSSINCNLHSDVPSFQLIPFLA